MDRTFFSFLKTFLINFLSFLTLDWSGLIIVPGNEHYLFSLEKPVVPSNTSVITLKVAKNGSCFHRSPLYTHTKSNSLFLVVSLISELTKHKSEGYIHDLTENKTYPLSNFLHIESWRDMYWQIFVTAKKVFYSFLLLIPLNLIAYLLYESIFMAFSKHLEHPSRYLSVFLRIIYAIIAYEALWEVQSYFHIFLSKFVFFLVFLHNMLFTILHHVLLKHENSRDDFAGGFVFAFLVYTAYNANYGISHPVLAFVVFLMYSLAMFVRCVESTELMVWQRYQEQLQMLRIYEQIIMQVNQQQLMQDFGVYEAERREEVHEASESEEEEFKEIQGVAEPQRENIEEIKKMVQSPPEETSRAQLRGRRLGTIQEAESGLEGTYSGTVTGEAFDSKEMDEGVEDETNKKIKKYH